MCRLPSIPLTSIRISAIPKPRKEWTARDYKVEASRERRLMVAFAIRNNGYKEPLTDRQKRVVERVRNGTDFHVSFEKLWELLK